MYMVLNLTRNIIVLSDLRAEIGPQKILDLEMIAARSAIDRSYDLKHALKTGRLRVTSHSVVRVDRKPEPVVKEVRVIERTIEKNTFDENKLYSMIKNAVAEQIGQKDGTDIEKTIQNALSSSMGGLMESIKTQIGALQPGKKHNEIPIDPAQFAEMQQKSVSKIKFDSNYVKQGRKIKIVNKNKLSDIAEEL